MPEPEKPERSDRRATQALELGEVRARILDRILAWRQTERRDAESNGLVFTPETSAEADAINDALIAGSAALRAPSPVAQELEAARKAVRDACTMCDGTGTVVGVASRSAHGCDGTEAMCAQVCPVEEQYQTEEECEYCGRPIAAIQQLINARLSACAPSPEEP